VGLFARVAVFSLLVVSFGYSAEIRGKVTNVIGGEPLARVQVTVLGTEYQTVTSRDGTFTIKGVGAGKYILRLQAVGYRLVTSPFSLSDGSEIKEFDVNLVPDNFRRTDSVVVTGDVF
jgi:Carboxypeptidase regulatory-like domain